MPDRMLQDIETGKIESNYDKTTISFDEMNLKSELLRGVYEYGLECPSSVQQRAIMPMIKGECRDDSDERTAIERSANEIIEGNDLIVQAPPAIGKTISLCISALQIIDPNIKTCQALILTPSADVTRSIHKTVIDIGQFAQINSLAIVKSFGIDDDISTLHDGQQFVVGTPGRVLDLIERRAITVDSTKLFVLDEADETISRGFTEQILAIHRFVPESAQVVLSSITMQDDMLETATRLTRDPLHIVIKGTKLSLSSIKQFYVAVEREDLRLDILSDLSATLGTAQAVIFCNTRKKVEWLVNELTTRGITTSVMHGDMPAYERADIIKEFRSGSSRILLATNMLARGLDVQQSSLVVNYELPAKVEEYIHRTSYNADFDRQCTTINLMDPAEGCRIHDIEHHYSTQVKELSIPEAKKILDFTGNTS